MPFTHPSPRRPAAAGIAACAALGLLGLLSACGGGDDPAPAGTPAAANNAAAAANLSCNTAHYTAGAVAQPTADELKTYSGTYAGDEGAFGPNPGDAFVKSGSATLSFGSDGSFSYKGISYAVASVCIDKVANGTGDRFVYVEAGKGLIDITSKGTAHGFSPVDGLVLFQNGKKQ